MRLPIVTLFLLAQNNSLVSIGLGYSIMSLTSIISDIPFGYFADKSSKKLMFALGLMMEACSSIFFIYSNNKISFYSAFIFWGAGVASSSGVLQSWYVNAYNYFKPKFSLAHVFKNIQIASNIATFLGIILGATIAQHWSYPIVFYCIFSGLTFYTFISMISLKNYKYDGEQNKNVSVPISLKDFILILKNIRLLSILIFSSTLGFIYSGYAVIWAPIFKEIVGGSITNSLFKSSFLYSLLYLLSGIALIFTNRLLRILGKDLAFQIYVLRVLFGISFIIMGLVTGNLYIFAFVTLVMFVLGYMEYAPLQELYNQSLPDRYRTLGLSIATTCEGVLGSLGGFIIAIIYDYCGVGRTLCLIGAIAIISALPIKRVLLVYKAKEAIL